MKCKPMMEELLCITQHEVFNLVCLHYLMQQWVIFLSSAMGQAAKISANIGWCNVMPLCEHIFLTMDKSRLQARIPALITHGHNVYVSLFFKWPCGNCVAQPMVAESHCWREVDEVQAKAGGIGSYHPTQSFRPNVPQRSCVADDIQISGWMGTSLWQGS